MKYALNNPQKGFLSFRRQLVMLSLVPLLLAVVATIVISWKSEQDKKKVILDNIKEKVEAKIDDYVEQIQDLSKINKNIIKDTDYKDIFRLQEIFWKQIQFNPYLNQIFYANKEGTYVSVRIERQGKDGNKTFVRYRNKNNKDNQGKIYEFKLDKQGQKEGSPKEIENFDPKTRPWYEDAEDNMKDGWTRAYPQFKPDTQLEEIFGITYYQPSINSETDKFQVVGLDLPLRLIKEYLIDITPREKNYDFLIFDCKKYEMIVRSISEPMFPKNIKDKCKRKDKQKFADNVDNYQVYTFLLDVKIPDYEWLLVIAKPQAVFESSFFILGILVLLIIILAFWVSLFLAHKISQPITIMTETAQALESEDFDSFDKDSLEKIGNQNNELGILAKVFLDMANKVYEREQSMRQKLQQLEETTNQQQKNSLLMEMTEREYLLQLIKKSQKNRQ